MSLEMCSGSEAGSHLRLIDFVYHSTLGVRVIKKRRGMSLGEAEEAGDETLVALDRPQHRISPRIVLRRFRKVDVRLPGNRNSNFHGARPVHAPCRPEGRRIVVSRTTNPWPAETMCQQNMSVAPRIVLRRCVTISQKCAAVLRRARI